MQPIDILNSGINSLADYLSAHVLTCLIPAFFIAAAITILINKTSILRYFGANTDKKISYSIASISGAILAVCSCTILPLFTGIYKRGAGIGPATAFLFSGPAVNILAIILTARILGWQLGAARLIGAVTASILIGLLMAKLFSKDDTDKGDFNVSASESKRPLLINLAFFGLLVAILIIGSTSTDLLNWTAKLAIIYLLTVILSIILIFYFERTEIKRWGLETWILIKKIFPILLVGVFIVGIIGGIAAYLQPGTDPATAVGTFFSPYLGENNIFSCLLASIIGALLYMPTLLEVTIIGDLFGYSSGLMSNGAALSLLLAGPSLSLPNMIVITKVIGLKKASAYISLVIIISTTIGFIYGVIGG